MPFWKSEPLLTRFWWLLFRRDPVSPTQSRHKRSFTVEPLEDRQLLAVDCWGLPSADFSTNAFDEHDSCVSSVACCDDLRDHRSQLVTDASQMEETALVYAKYFADENYTPVRPMTPHDWFAYNTFSTFQKTVTPNVFESVRDYFSQKDGHSNADPQTIQEALEALPVLQAHGRITPMRFSLPPFAFDDKDDGGMQGRSGGSESIPNVSIALKNGSPTEIIEHLGISLSSSGASGSSGSSDGAGDAQQWFTFQFEITLPPGDTHWGQDVELKLGGTATPGSDYKLYWMDDTEVYADYPNGTFTIHTSGDNAVGKNTSGSEINGSTSNGVCTLEFKVIPVDDTLVEANETITISIVPKTPVNSGGTSIGYTDVGGKPQVKIIDDDTLTLENVSFKNNLDLLSDMDHPTDPRRAFGASWQSGPHWVKGYPDKTLPVAYANGNNKITTDAKYSGSIASNATVEVRFIASWFPSGLVYSEWVAVNPSSLSATGIQSLQTLVTIYCTQQADYIAGMQLQWEIRVNADDNTIRAVDGTSTNPFYVTRTDPGTSVYHTVVHTGCVAAKYQPNESAAFDAIWGKFASLEIYSVQVVNGAVVDNELLTYYGRDSSDATIKSRLYIESVGGAIQAPSQFPTIARQFASNANFFSLCIRICG